MASGLVKRYALYDTRIVSRAITKSQLRAIHSIFVGFAIVSPSVAEIQIPTADVLINYWNFEGLSAPTIIGPMCVAKPRPLPCGVDCWRAQLDGNSEPAANQKELSGLLAVFLADLKRSEAFDAEESIQRDGAILRRALYEMLEAHNQH